MRRGATGTAGLVLAGLVLAGCTAPAGPSTTPPVQPPTATPSATSAAPAPSGPSATPAGAPACTAEAGALGLRRQVGQLVMVGVGVDLTGTQKAAITDHHLGSAIVMGPTPGGVEQVAELTARLRELGGDDLLVAADQEGGLVQRLKGPGFGTIPSAARQARLSDAGLAAAAEGWGRAMAKAGVLLDLAPVADVVPAKFRASNEPVARLGRGYGSDPEKVSRKVAAFSAGLHAAGVGVAVKHFPGLGAVRGNTDFATSVLDTTTTASSALLTPFRDAVEHGADAVMVSSATYRRIDPDRPAMFSPTVVGLLREWGFEGVVVSDDLGAAAALRSVPVARRAERFVAAGGDLALTVDARTAGAMAEGLYAAAKDDPELAARVAESAARVLALKARLGRFSCG
ncbi:MAG: glycoside hydrolase family 3 N-terminal domain-containing protein [Propionicimonas sp.]